MITAKIDVTKIDKGRLFHGKNGAQYLDIVLMDRDDAYGNNYMVVQSVSKEEREAGKRGAILGNGKNMGGQNQAPAARRSPPKNNENLGDDMDGCPF